MKYQNADTIFPASLLSEIQKYVQDGMIYIPKPKEEHKKWGENTQSKKMIFTRNNEIKSAFQRGSSIEELSGDYFLSLESIKKIVYCNQ